MIYGMDQAKRCSDYERDELMNEKYDKTDLRLEADEKIRTFQEDSSRNEIFHHLITLPTYHTAASIN